MIYKMFYFLFLIIYSLFYIKLLLDSVFDIFSNNITDLPEILSKFFLTNSGINF